MRLTQLLRVMEGEGGRKMNNKRIQGMTLASLKHHVALQPLFAIMGAGITFVVYYCFRLAVFNPDVDWSKKGEPQQYYKTAQYKFLNPSGVDYTRACKAPDYKD